MCSDRDHAGVPGPPFWRREDQNVPGCPLAAAVRLHEDISRPHSWAPPSPASHWRSWSRAAFNDGSLLFPSQTDLYSGALFIQVCLGWNLYLSTVLMLVVTALYTIAGNPLCKTTANMPQPFHVLAEVFSYFHGYFRRSGCCHLHRHSPDGCDDNWSHHPDNHGFVHGTFKKNPKQPQNTKGKLCIYVLESTQVCVPHPQPSTRLVALGTWSTCTAWRCPVKSFPTAPATYHARTPCTCSGTPSPETCLGLAWPWASPYWPRGTGAPTRYTQKDALLQRARILWTIAIMQTMRIGVAARLLPQINKLLFLLEKQFSRGTNYFHFIFVYTAELNRLTLHVHNKLKKKRHCFIVNSPRLVPQQLKKKKIAQQLSE